MVIIESDYILMIIIMNSNLGQKVNGPGFALGKTLLGAHKVENYNLHLT